jgi:hypothetical protein
MSAGVAGPSVSLAARFIELEQAHFVEWPTAAAGMVIEKAASLA